MNLFRVIILALCCFLAGGGDSGFVSAKTKKTRTTVTKSKTQTKNTGTKKNSPKTSAEAKKQQEQARKEIQLTEAQIKENEAKVSKGLAELGKLDREIEKTTTRINDLKRQLNRINGEIGTLETGIDKNEAELAKLREEYLKAVKKMRVTKKNKSSLAFIFSSKSVNQAMRRMRYLREFSSWRERQTGEINGKLTDLKNQKAALTKAREERQDALALQNKSEAELAGQHKRQEMLVGQLKENGKALEAHLQRKQAEARELGNMVSQLIAEEQRKAAAEEARKRAEEESRRRAAAEEERRKAEQEALLAQETGSKKEDKGSGAKSIDRAGKDKDNKASESSKKSDKKNEKPTEYADARKRKPRSTNSQEVVAVSSGDSFQEMRGKLPNPSTGSFIVTSGFGRQNLPDLPGVEYDNPGIDAETEAGASARAVYKGKVSGVYLLPGYNTVVIVNHGNYYTVYGNIVNPEVKTGDEVVAGTRLGGLARNEDDSRHASIHFEVWKNREKLNPQEWLSL